MKHLLLITAAAFLFSCNNKEAIVEQIKSAKDSAQYYKNWESFYSLYGKEMGSKGRPEFSDKRFLDQVPQHVIDNKKWDSARIVNYGKSVLWQGKVDSLELELKKY